MKLARFCKRQIEQFKDGINAVLYSVESTAE